MALTDFIDLRTANVYGIYGHLGGGKTLTAVELMLFFLTKGFTVVSNVKLLNLEPKHKGKYQFIEDFQGVDFWQLPCGAPRGSDSDFKSVIVIDEVAEYFDQYSSSSPVLKSFLSWLRHSSKRGQFVILIVQQREFVAKSLRLLVNKWICCDDLEQFRLPMIRMKIPFMSPYVRRIMFDKMGNLISRGMNIVDKREIGWYYNTAQSIALEGRSNDFTEHTEKVFIIPRVLWILAFLFVALKMLYI